MADQFDQELQGLHAGGFITITLNANTADITVGGNGQSGGITLKDDSGAVIARIGKFPSNKPNIPASVVLSLSDDGGQARIQCNASTADVRIGGSNENGTVELLDENNKTTIQFSAESAYITAGGNGKTGTLVLQSKDGAQRFYLGIDANLIAGGNGADGDVFLVPGNADPSKPLALQATIHLDAGGANVWLGGDGQDGDLMLFHENEQDNDNSNKASIHLNGELGVIKLRRWDAQKGVVVDAISLEAHQGNVWLGGKGVDGDLMLFSKDEQDNHNSDKASIHLDGDKGDIMLRNADCAEEFDIAGCVAVEPGTVMVISDDGGMRPSSDCYDRKVAGVVSGAGPLRPGIILGRQPGSSERLPIALAGKVFCRVDASEAPVRTGDLLTTSRRTGHAMRAVERARAFGAVIGKALAPLARGQGTIPILVALQ